MSGAGATGAPAGVDLDLGFMFELSDGQPGLVQALGNAWGNYDRAPFIKLQADDRTGQNRDGENLLITANFSII